MLILEALPDDVPADVRFRRALKCLLRGFKLRCLFVGDREPQPAPAVKPKRRKRAADAPAAR